jgi:hypothetical protein
MVGIYRLFHPTTRQYTFFSAGHGTFSKIGHISGHKASLNKFKKTEITPNHIRSPCSKTRQQQKTPTKIYKHMETEQHTVEKPVSD